ncbi:polynucleotide adenylyltransferase PcnB [Psychrobacter sp. AH5]|uniref:polynucleotide adenylyltransferase PcnB n=1 Tax=Psychrobacter sp. AH5 TaxID=2937433 RepID=UPI0033426D12
MAERAAKQLELNKSELPNSITEVIATLSRAGFDAYIVGGGVRDTLLGLQPKDFDAVTDAKPHEIKDVFGKRCRIIGRRFQLAHVYSGRELIEVATFRGPPNNNASTNQDGMILRDNVWGDIKQDFARRDFSINALYYQPLKGIVHDFCGALEDIRNKTIRLLGNAPVRIEEDPVRLLRALRFKAKLGFEFDAELSEQFHDDNWALLDQISPHRLYDETQKMFTGGYLVPLLPLLFESGAIDSLMIYPPSEPSPLVQQVAINTDKRIAAGKSINPAFFYAALLWENYLHQLEKAKNRNMPFAEAQLHAASKVIDRQRIKTAIPKFAEQFIRDIWILQPKLSAPRNKQIEQLAEHPRFRAGFDFLLLREQCGDSDHPLSESTNGMGEWWQTYQTLSESQQQQAIADFDENIRRGAYKQGQRGRGRNRQKNQTNNTQPKDQKQTSQPDQVKVSQSSTNQAVNDATNIPSRRRRRNSDKAASSSSHQQTTSTEQSLQDSQELEQLQQLSLAAIKHSHKKPAAPKPLFVIEHEKVVQPLKRQLDGDTGQATIDKTTTNKTTADKVTVNKVTADKVTKSNGRKVSANNKAAIDNQAATKPENKDSADTNVQQPTKQSKRTKTEVTTSVAQTPKMVTLNNEPIPSKRRRKLPSSSTSAILVTAPLIEDKPVSQAKSETYEKKALKSVAPQANSAAKMTATKSPKLANAMANKGAIPAKRRRRQPSTDNAQGE